MSVTGRASVSTGDPAAAAAVARRRRCSDVRQLVRRLAGDLDRVASTALANDPAAYQIMAMSTLASGAIPGREAYEFVNKLNVQSVVFGASSRKHVEETVHLIDLGGGVG